MDDRTVSFLPTIWQLVWSLANPIHHQMILILAVLTWLLLAIIVSHP